ncbi:hypothetical protein RhiirA4_484258 [Rhizophagus irregularis]|uniref:Uncharacterized protein n=1 Tax=Rhizophagus irregularis TaxID=588596 RepID=A0A2I1HNN7_9GLOM|nr:hypothetical protein RhiirA4_484258 [Rhizophagus irregularis]
MSQNIPKQLKHKLKTADFKIFNKDFWKTRNLLCVEVFERRFQELLENFPNSNNSICNSWARAFTTSRIFYSRSTMAEAVEYLDSQIDINALIKKHFSPHIVAEIHKQMCESVLYKCEKLSLENANNFDNDQMVMYDTHLIISVEGLLTNGFLQDSGYDLD